MSVTLPPEPLLLPWAPAPSAISSERRATRRLPLSTATPDRLERLLSSFFSPQASLKHLLLRYLSAFLAYAQIRSSAVGSHWPATRSAFSPSPPSTKHQIPSPELHCSKTPPRPPPGRDGPSAGSRLPSVGSRHHRLDLSFLASDPVHVWIVVLLLDLLLFLRRQPLPPGWASLTAIPPTLHGPRTQPGRLPIRSRATRSQRTTHDGTAVIGESTAMTTVPR